MIVCTKHGSARGWCKCELQERAQRQRDDAQRDGDAVVLYLIDRDDPTHIALATLGTSKAVERMVETQLALIEVQIRCSGDTNERATKPA